MTQGCTGGGVGSQHHLPGCQGAGRRGMGRLRSQGPWLPAGCSAGSVPPHGHGCQPSSENCRLMSLPLQPSRNLPALASASEAQGPSPCPQASPCHPREGQSRGPRGQALATDLREGEERHMGWQKKNTGFYLKGENI